MAQTLFTLGFQTTNSPWSYQHTMGISTKDIESWWKNSYPGLKDDLTKAQAAGLGPGNAPLSTTQPGRPSYVPQPQDNSSSVLLVSVLLVGGGLAAYYFYKKNKDAKGKKASA